MLPSMSAGLRARDNFSASSTFWASKRRSECKGEEGRQEDRNPAVCQSFWIRARVAHEGEYGSNKRGDQTVDDESQTCERFGTVDAVVEVGDDRHAAVAMGFVARASIHRPRAHEMKASDRDAEIREERGPGHDCRGMMANSLVHDHRNGKDDQSAPAGEYHRSAAASDQVGRRQHSNRHQGFNGVVLEEDEQLCRVHVQFQDEYYWDGHQREGEDDGEVVQVECSFDRESTQEEEDAEEGGMLE
ncbi:hypothetical protein EJ03DRAFT_54654 [Teratosphaeria nubilosa]|uniref:Uncharacterized protein n=1 Tax=Teratosphaeria nubilosa TaxID=161662 RepID=A0A6G1LDT3_9PEZI|nr:hypothetical protein EJ03DRAFT_54654 [Teratosphaeria nubilosa]